MILSSSPRAVLRTGVCAASIWIGLAAAPVAAQSSQQAADDQPAGDAPATSGPGIVVQAERLSGQLDVEQPPLLELNEEDIAAEGVTSIADLVEQISARSGSARGRGGGGRPVILINGIRVGSFREFFQYPPEALARVEVFPEEVAQRFGFPPDRRVVNLILKENFASREVELEFEGPSRGGYHRREQELGYLQIADGGRLNFNFEASDTSLLTEAERDIIQTPGSVSDIATDPDQAEFRSLVSDSRSLEGNVSWAKAFIDSGTAVSANLNYTRNDSRSLSGLNTVTLDDGTDSALRTFGEDTPLERRVASDVLSGSGSISKSVNGFRLTSTFDASLNERETEVDRRFDTTQLEADAAAGLLAIDGTLPTAVDSGFDIASTRNITGSSQTTLRGPLAYLPAGELIATFDLGVDWTRIESTDTRSLQETELTRRQLTSGANLIIPITSRRNGFADALGSFTLTAQAGFEDLSDFGLLGDYNIALNWAPTERLNFTANYIVREVAPSLAALGNPQITTFNAPVFDFTNGQTVLATVISGGNPDLLAETQRDWRFALSWQLPFMDNSRFTIEYVRNRSEDVTSAFPVLTPEIEAAFPGRVTRDAAGTLVALDQRSVTFAETRSDRLQFNFFTGGSFGAGEQGGRGGEGRGGGRGRGGPPERAGGPPSEEQREQFRQFRARLCADDGLEFITRLIERVEAGEDVSDEIPGFDPQRFERILSRVRDENGAIQPERLAAFRERFCSMDPAMFGGRGGPQRASAEGADAQAGAQQEQGPGGPMRAAFAALRERICGEDGAEQLARIIEAIENGEDTSEILPGMDPEFLKRMLDRARGEDGTISPEALGQFRERVCSGQGGPGGGQGGARGGGGFFGGGNPFAQGRRPGWRYFISLNHTIELENDILIAPGLDRLDQLDGDATGAFGFPRHNTRLEAGLFGNGLGFRLSGRYVGETRLDGSGLPGSTDLFFGDLATFDLRVFSNLGELTGKNEGLLKNLRVSLRADNIFDARRKVRDENGETPINYQPFLIDPTGLYLGIDIRKLF